jgi:hypothetical protein
MRISKPVPIWAGLSIFPAMMPLQGFPAVEYDSNYDEADAPMDQKKKEMRLVLGAHRFK